MRVLVVHQPVGPQATQDDQDVLVQATAVAESLVRLGHTPVVHPAGKSPGELEQLICRLQPDVVFNLIESFFGKDFFQWLGAGVLSNLGIPFTGSGEDALFLTGDKLIAKSMLRAAGLPTPEWIAPPEIACDWLVRWEPRCLAEDCAHDDVLFPRVSTTDIFRRLQQRHAEKWRFVARREEVVPGACPSWGFLQKSAWSHASAGLVEELWQITTPDDQARLCHLLSQRSWQSQEPWFAERYIDGREFNLSLIAGETGPIVFPPAEIDFSAFPPEKLRIVGYNAKWQADSFEYSATPRRFAFPEEDQPLLRQLEAVARECWRVFGLRGYVRVDFRVDSGGQPWILEINTNPCLSPDAGFAAAGAQAGWSFDRIVEAILADALRASSHNSGNTCLP